MTTKNEEHLTRYKMLLNCLPQRIIVRDAMEIWGMSSTAATIYELKKLEELGLVRHLDRGTSGEWRLESSD